jgi:DNA-directed RNA polymerase subunit RPC12/RpoP
MLSDKTLADAGFWLYCSEYADEFERHGGSFGAGAEITQCVDRLADEKYVPIMRKYEAELAKGWGMPCEEVFDRMGLNTSDYADALYYCLMSCRGHGVGLDDKFPDGVKQYEDEYGELDQSPIHTELQELTELAAENLETPDPEFRVVEVATGDVIEGKYWTREKAEERVRDWGGNEPGKYRVENVIVAAYPDGKCPDCGEEIPDDVEEGDACENCGHVFWKEVKVE